MQTFEKLFIFKKKEIFNMVGRLTITMEVFILGLTSYLTIFYQVPNILRLLDCPPALDMSLDILLTLFLTSLIALLYRSFHYANTTSSHVIQNKQLLQQMLEYKATLKKKAKQERLQSHKNGQKLEEEEEEEKEKKKICCESDDKKKKNKKYCCENERVEDKKRDDRWCNACQIYKIRDIHHCSYCAKCVEGLDHHCQFLNNCIGERNYKFFISFVFNTFIYLSVVILMNLKDFYTLVTLRWDKLYIPVYLLLIAFSFAFIMALFTFFLFLYHCFLILNNTTTLNSKLISYSSTQINYSFKTLIYSLFSFHSIKTVYSQFTNNFKKRLNAYSLNELVWPEVNN